MRVWRVDVRPSLPEWDATGRTCLAELHGLGFAGVRSLVCSRLFFLESEASAAEIARICAELLADPVTERYSLRPADESPPSDASVPAVEVHLRPGVMDPVAASTQAAIRELGLAVGAVRTAKRFEFQGDLDRATLAAIARRVLANDCVEEIYVLGFGGPAPPSGMPTARPYRFSLRHVPVRDVDDPGLARLSREAHLFLSLEEMRAVRDYFRRRDREPTDLELETLAQTWSEHCIHKTLRSEVIYRGAPMPSGQGTDHERQTTKRKARSADSVEIQYANLLKETIFAATEAHGGDWCLSVFADNAGVIAFDDEYGVAFKVETHNHPSAIEPYGGAATGVGGCIRDVIGCGLAAKPIANTDIFCFAPPDWPVEKLPKGVLHPRTVMRGVVAGVRDYGNRMGIPTVNGAIHFDPRYLGNPLVFCGCIGLIPRARITKAARPGDAIMLVGGRTGRDGIHGATFSSAELTDTHAEEFAHAVQIGNPITEKKFLDCILQARDHAGGCLFTAITDCGAGGLSSAVGEMGRNLGAAVDLEKVPLKYEGLRYDEIWISEAQERMVLAVPPANVETLLSLFAAEDVEATVIGHFTGDKRLIVRYEGNVVGELEMDFLHEGLPKTTRLAEWRPGQTSKRQNVKTSKRQNVKTSKSPRGGSAAGRDDEAGELLGRLGCLNVASKEWVIRQYDHEVQGGSVIKPLVGPGGGPSDAAVIRPRLDSDRGIAIGCGLCPQMSDEDPYWMAVAAVDEAVRNVVCVGGDPERMALLDNFCWGRTDDPHQLGALVRACQGAHDAAVANGTPFISGKDSLNNEFAMDAADAGMLRAYLRERAHAAPGCPASSDVGDRGLRNNRLDGSPTEGCPTSSDVGDGASRNNRLSIPGTLLISAVSVIDDVSRCVTMDLKDHEIGDGLWAFWVSWHEGSAQDGRIIERMADLHRFIHEGIRQGFFVAVHDFCDDDVLVAVAEMCIAGQVGALIAGEELDKCRERPAASGYVVQQAVRSGFSGRLAEHRERWASSSDVRCEVASLGAPVESGCLQIRRSGRSGIEIPLEDLARAWRSPFDW